ILCDQGEIRRATRRIQRSLSWLMIHTTPAIGNHSISMEAGLRVVTLTSLAIGANQSTITIAQSSTMPGMNARADASHGNTKAMRVNGYVTRNARLITGARRIFARIPMGDHVPNVARAIGMVARDAKIGPDANLSHHRLLSSCSCFGNARQSAADAVADSQKPTPCTTRGCHRDIAPSVITNDVIGSGRRPA